MVKISDLVAYGAELLSGAAESPVRESRILLSFVLGCTISDVIINSDSSVPDDKKNLYESCVKERAKGKPLAYITGEKEFYGLKFAVNSDTLIPRPETELLTDVILASGKRKLLDLCTGSGCIPVSAAVNNPDISAVGVDISAGALEIAGRNAKAHGVADRVVFKESDIFSGDVYGKFDIITSNPPYITKKDMLNLSPEVSEYEPLSALFGGEDGLDFYRHIVTLAPENLNPGGLLAFEVGFGQADSVRSLMAKSFTNLVIKKDLAGIDRVVMGQLNNS